MNRDDFRDIWAMLAPLKRKLALVATRVVVSLVKDDRGTQGLQAEGLEDEIFDGTEHMQPGGLSHVPLAGAEGIALAIGGARDNAVIICVGDRRYRVKGLAGGETAIFNEGATQSKTVYRANGDIETTLAALAKVKMGAATESFVKGDTFVTAFTTWLTAHDTYIKIPTPTGVETTAYATASTALTTALNTTVKSATIKGE